MHNIYKECENRKQQMFFPSSIDEYVSEDNPVRVIDEYVELLDMVKLGFTKANLGSIDGQPAYHPKLLLKIYIYGYLNKIRTSRKLETEIKRNVELMWLCAGLKPSYKTIADFRKENSKPLKQVFKEFVLLCKEIELISGKDVAIDGAFLRANASKNQLIMKKSVIRDLEKIDKSINEYLKTLDFADKEERQELNLKPQINKLSSLKKRKAKLDEDLALLEELKVNQYNRTDPDAKLMVKPAHNLMAFNSQIAVDAKYKFIVATDISTRGRDTQELYKMAKETKENLKIDKSESININSDTGYYNPKEIKKCKDDNINVIVPIPKIETQKNRGYFTREEFIYDKTKDCYICPNNQLLNKRPTSQKRNGKINFIYAGASAICKACPLKSKCLPGQTPYKQLFRWEYEEIVIEHKKKMQSKKAKEMVKKRGSIVEHPFGTIKQHLGWSHFLVRGKEKVSGENALIMFTYNFRRLLNLIGITLFRKLLKAIKSGNIEAIKAEIA